MNKKSYFMNQFKEAVVKNTTLKKYLKQNGKTAYRRFWNLFRTDLMRKCPEETDAFLKRIDKDSKLAELPSGSEFGQSMATVFSEGLNESENMIQEQRIRQEALIYSCVEMDAACRLEASGISRQEKNNISTFLELWRLPI